MSRVCRFCLMLQCGCARFPTSVHMVLVYINFLSSVQDNQQAANSQLQLARKLHANWTDRWGWGRGC
jgi:hypothetical protein